MYFVSVFCHDVSDCCREVLLEYVTGGADVQVLGSLSVLATLLQTKGCKSECLFASPLHLFLFP